MTTEDVQIIVLACLLIAGGFCWIKWLWHGAVWLFRKPVMKALRFVCPGLVAAWEDFAADLATALEIRAMIRRAEKENQNGE